MNLYPYFKSLLDEDKTAVVICDTEHKIIYMNPSACERYEKYGGEKLLGGSLLDCHPPQANEMILKVIDWFRADKGHNRLFTYHSEKENKDVYMIALRDSAGELIGYYEKHEYRNPESEKIYNFN